MKFKIGDKVKIRKESRWYSEKDTANPINEIGVINDIFGTNISVTWKRLDNSYTEKDLELVEDKSNRQLAKEYLYDILNSKTISIKTSLENRDKFYKILNHLEIKYYEYEKRTLDNYKELFSKADKPLSQSAYLQTNLKTIDFEYILKEYKQILNK